MARETGDILSVPYDFDMSGFVNAAYAVPNPQFRIRTVRTRLYRGRCINNEHLDNTLQAYQDRKQDIYQLVNGLEHLTDKTRKQLIRYIDDFYATVDDPKQLDSRLRKRCHLGPASFLFQPVGNNFRGARMDIVSDRTVGI